MASGQIRQFVMDAYTQPAHSLASSAPRDVGLALTAVDRPMPPDHIVLRGLPSALHPAAAACALDQPGDHLSPPALLTALQGLIDLVLEVRSPDSGWDPTLPQTPDTVLPYVSEEVGMLQTPWQDWQKAQCPPSKATTISPTATALQTLTTIMAKWLWQMDGL